MATVRKKVDNRIRVQIENGVALQHRTMFVVVGDRGRDQVMSKRSAPVAAGWFKLVGVANRSNLSVIQVVILHHMLSKASVRARPSVLWCYKKDLGFSR